MRLKRKRKEGVGCLVEGGGRGGGEEVVWGIKDARRQKGGARGGYLGEFLEVHLKKYFEIFFFAIEKCGFNGKKGFFLGFLRFRLNSDFPQLFFPNLNSCFKGQIKKRRKYKESNPKH